MLGVGNGGWEGGVGRLAERRRRSSALARWRSSMTFAPTGPGAVGAGEGVAEYRAPILNGIGVWGIPDMGLIGSVIFLGLVALLNLADAHNLSRQPVFFCGDCGWASIIFRDVTFWGFPNCPPPQVAIRSIAPMHDFSEGGGGLRAPKSGPF